MAESAELNIVTGAYGYTGKYITRRLLAHGKQVKTLTNHPQRENEFGSKVEPIPFNFDRYTDLVAALKGATTLYNTYWVRLNRGPVSFDQAVENSHSLFHAAKDAGIRRIVHISVSHADSHSRLPYYRGKGQVEEALKSVGVSYAVIRPTLTFGPEDILINNIAWLLRRFPMFAVAGRGNYNLQPVSVEDVAEIAVAAGQSMIDQVLYAAGPEIFSFDQFVRSIKQAINSRSLIVHMPSSISVLLGHIAALLVRDVILTRDELDGLMLNLLISDQPPTGRARFSQWLSQNASALGKQYHSELARHYRN